MIQKFVDIRSLRIIDRDSNVYKDLRYQQVQEASMVADRVDYSNVYDVVEIQFSIMSPDEILMNSVVPVFQTDINEGSSLDTPKCNGVNDPRLGPSQPGPVICPTDESTFKNCPGYFGHLELAKPVFWPQFLDYVFAILKITCYNCSKLLVDVEGADRIPYANAQKAKGKARFDRMRKINPKKACLSCNAVQPKYVKEPHNCCKIIGEFKSVDSMNTKRVQFSAERVRTIMQRITDHDVEALGFSQYYSRPEWMICTVLPVPPPAIRPSSTRTDSSQRSEDDLTTKLLEIVKFNKELARKIQADQNANNIDDFTQLLQFHVTTFVNNDMAGMFKAMRKSGAPFKSITARFKGKTGRIRGNLMGKRADFSARTVITGDPTISMEEVGVPMKIAMNLTYPEVVTKYNIDEMTRLVRNGPFNYPGAKSVQAKGAKSGAMKQLHALAKLGQLDTVQLRLGDTVMRHLRDGDIVLFNRQPSLHRMSMLSHRVRVLPGLTFRLQLSVVAPYNAD